MKKSEDMDGDKMQAIVDPDKIKSELNKNLEYLQELSGDNTGFLIKLLKECALIGKDREDGETTYFTDIEKLIKFEYTYYLSEEPGKSILQTSRKLIDSLCYVSKITNAETISTNIPNDFRDTLEGMISNFCNNIDVKNDGVFLMGDF